MFGVSRKTLSKILNEHGPITPDMALRLSKAFKTTPELWLNLHIMQVPPVVQAATRWKRYALMQFDYAYKMKLIIAIAVCLVLTNPAAASEPAAGHPASWAQPVKLDGVPNLHKVSDSLYRSAQPTAQGMKNLKQMGIETVVNLRSFHSDRDEIGTTGLGYEHIYMKAWHPERKEAVRFLQIVTNPDRTPVLVHCLHGADRTGTMSALYRIAVQGWTKEEAVREMTEGGFNFHTVFDNLPGWIQELDVESVMKDTGIKAGAGPGRAGNALEATHEE